MTEEKAKKEEKKPEVKAKQETKEEKPQAKKEKAPAKKQKESSSARPDIEAGNVVKVHQKLKEGDKERTQVFEGIVIAKQGKTEFDRTITVRKVCNGGFGVERIFPVASPLIEKIEVIKKPKVRRSKLYYLRKSPRKMRELLTK